MAFLTIDPIIEDWIEDNELQQENISKTKLKRWAIDIIKDFTTVDMHTHKIALLNVNNTKAVLPSDFKRIISVAYRTLPDKEKCTPIKEVVQYTQYATTGCELEINVKCTKCHKLECSCNTNSVVEVDIDRIQLAQNPWWYDVSRFGKPIDSDQLYNLKENRGNNFRLMAHAVNPFHNVNYHIPDCINLTVSDCDRRYKISDDLSVIETDIVGSNAEVLIAYLGERTTENGDPYIPDNTNAIEAIEYQLTYKYFKPKFNSTGNQAYRTAYLEAAERRDLAVGRLKMELSIPNPDQLRAELSQIMNRPRSSAPTRVYKDFREPKY